jgi:hypothetical protein
VGADVADLIVHRWPTERTTRPVHRSRVSQVASGALHRYFQSKESGSPFTETLIHRSRSIPSRGTSSGRCRQDRSAASHGCSARNLPVVVLIDGHRPPLINCVDDIDFGFERKLKRPHGNARIRTIGFM